MIVRLVLFATAREAAGRGRDTFDVPAGASVGHLITEAVERYGDDFARVLASARVWVNGEDPGGVGDRALAGELHDGDEVAVLPPVSGGALR